MRSCLDRNARWNGKRCVPCHITVEPGTEISPNCGYGDNDDDRHEGPLRPCKDNTFNDGSRDNCTLCTTCPPGQRPVRLCSKTFDSLCSPPGNAATTATTGPDHGRPLTPSLPVLETPAHSPALWAVPLALFAFIVIAVSVYIGRMKRRKGRRIALGYNGRPSYTVPGFAKLDVEEILCLNVRSAPLQTVLDNLDVLEELVILLDPESQGVKNTKHLASLCSFPAPWIKYAYSMKDSKSPLRAVLEGVACRDPDWTVGDLAKLLRRMERNDAIAALAKLRVDKMDV